MLDKNNIPKHIAIIMDGNRRWAKKRGLPPVAGHAYVVEKLLEPLIEKCGELGVEHLTLWAFSTENWKREKTEVDGVMNIFREAIEKKARRFIEKGARLHIIGDLSRFPADIQAGMKKLVGVSKKNNKVQVNLAINYGGRDEVVRGVRRMVGDNANDYARVSPLQKSARERPLNTNTLNAPEGQTSREYPQDLTLKSQPLITEEMLEKYLDTAGIPDPEMIIRAGGEKRLSGFMLWQSQYSELIFTETLMPDFGPEKLEKAIEEYQGRQRRFGK